MSQLVVDVVAAACIRIALIILLASGVGLHFAEERLQHEADRDQTAHAA